MQVTEGPESAQSLTAGPSVSADEPSLLSEQFVLVHLVETHKLLSAADSHLKKPAQLRLQVMAEAFLSIFDEEKICVRYWLFSRFARLFVDRVQPHLDKMVISCTVLCIAHPKIMHRLVFE